MLKDDAASVRLRVALALTLSHEKNGVPVLIDLLAVLPDDQVSQAEEVLHQLAGDTAPEVPLGTEAGEKKKCRDAWAAWWKTNAKRVDMTRLSEHPLLGYTMICHGGQNRIVEIDRQGKERWSIANINGGVDAVILPRQRILIAECNVNRVTERDLKGNILWQKQVNVPVNIQRLPNGNTFIAGQNYLVEVDRTGKEVYKIQNVPGGVLSAYRLRRRRHRVLDARQPVPHSGHDRQSPQDVHFQPQRQLSGRSRCPAERSHSRAPACLQQNCRVRSSGQGDSGSEGAESDRGDAIAERPHSRRQSPNRTYLRGGPHG